MAGTSKNRIRGTVTANLGLLTPTQAFLGADLDDCIGATAAAHTGRANDRSRREGVIAMRFGEGPLIEAKAVLRCRQGPGATSQRLLQLGTCSPGQPPEGELDGTAKALMSKEAQIRALREQGDG